jgi:hypothetical protein
MFEGKPPRIAHATSAEGDSLRPLAWADLVSRLAAVRDLRTDISQTGTGEASFDPFCARRMASHRNDPQFVNLEDSANVKSAGPNRLPAPIASRRGAVR